MSKTCNFIIRPAQPSDIPALDALIVLSAQELSQGFMPEEEIKASIDHIYGVDTELVSDGTYFVAEKDGKPVACGGWSKRKTLFGGDRYAGREAGFLDPAIDAAKIRAFFVHPDYARQGIAHAMLEKCEAEMKDAGFMQSEMMATLPGIPFYERNGYRRLEEHVHQLPNGSTARGVRMSKAI
mgnify:CR=1 FL=1